MKLLNRMAPVGQPGQLCQWGLRRQVAPEIFPLLRLPLGGALADQPALVSLPVTGHPPTPHGHKFLAQPPFGASPPANSTPLPAGHAVEQLVCTPYGRARRAAHAHL